MKSFQLEIVTPTRMLDEGEVSAVRCPGTDGLFGVLAQHARAIFALEVGEVKITRRIGEEIYLSTSGGFAEVEGDRVQLLVETAERSSEIDVERARNAESRARERIMQPTEGIDTTRARSSLMRALNRLRVAAR